MENEVDRRELLRFARTGMLLATGLGLAQVVRAEPPEGEAMQAREYPSDASYAMKLYKIEGKESKLVATYATVSDLTNLLKEPPKNVKFGAAKDGGGSGGGGGGGSKDITFGLCK